MDHPQTVGGKEQMIRYGNLPPPLDLEWIHPSSCSPDPFLCYYFPITLPSPLSHFLLLFSCVSSPASILVSATLVLSWALLSTFLNLLSFSLGVS
ncbi:uncharacterized protein BDW47DRAFT_111245 [Aspergillus candidus]|uniref:Uncharacterized protein n=1 Tax=Aspergillus candidus TaxID=41067 RepID=A0A2I2F304_ASPCN|nr:hypothetical protein BDW47DRAFT_111245 [Aspergillus candidus]PLB35010.1 hypothetical protein BDW47DRAFT_111245 [Aspergillus candidus]